MDEQHVTFIMSVPNDAFWSIQNPHHATAWGEGAFEELRGLLPAGTVVLRQLSLSGSAIAAWDSDSEQHALEVDVSGSAAIASHFIAVIGARAGEVRRGAMAVATDVLAQRTWERQRESELAVAQQLVREQAEEIAEQFTDLQQRNVWFEEWRTYIHELERELGKPISGVTADELPNGRTPE